MNDWVNIKANEGQKVKQANGTATVTASAAATFDPECTSFRLKNLSSTKKLLWSIDAGTTYMKLEPFSTEEKAYIARSLLLKTESGTAVWTLEYTEARL